MTGWHTVSDVKINQRVKVVSPLFLYYVVLSTFYLYLVVEHPAMMVATFVILFCHLFWHFLSGIHF